MRRLAERDCCGCGWVSAGRWSRDAASLLSPQELGLLQDYLLALTTDDHLLRCAAQVLCPLQSQLSPSPLPPGSAQSSVPTQSLPSAV